MSHRRREGEAPRERGRSEGETGTQVPPPPTPPTHSPAQAGAHVGQEGQPGDPLHGEDEEGDHGEAPAGRPPLDLPEGVSEGGVAAPAGTGEAGQSPEAGGEQVVSRPPPDPRPPLT